MGIDRLITRQLLFTLCLEPDLAPDVMSACPATIWNLSGGWVIIKWAEVMHPTSIFAQAPRPGVTPPWPVGHVHSASRRPPHEHTA